MTEMLEFQVGELVLILLPDGSDKQFVQWQGPYSVKAKGNTITYGINMTLTCYKVA